MRRYLLIATLAGVCICITVGKASGQPGDQQPILLETPAVPAGYAQLLRDIVVQTPLPDGGFETRVDYVKLFEDPGQQRLRAEIRRRFLSLDPASLDDATRQAWAVNAYNFLVIDIIMEQLAVAGEVVSIADIGAGDFAVFDEDILEIGEEVYSLNRFETHFLFREIDRKTRVIPEGLDPRIHFVLVCAAKGCPPLWPEPFRPEKLDAQLDEATRNALMSQRHLRVDAEGVHVSKLFDWFGRDFDGHGGPAGFLLRYAPTPMLEALEDEENRLVVYPDLEWDWSLNQP